MSQTTREKDKTVNDLIINNSIRMKDTVRCITNALNANDLESAENWARHLEMQVISFRVALAFKAAEQSEKVGA